MYDIKPLEEKWERYNKKRKRPLYFGIGIFLLFTTSMVFYFMKSDKVIALPNKNTVTVVYKNDTSVLLNKPLETLVLKRDQDKDPTPLNSNPIPDIPTQRELKKPVVKEKTRKKVHLNIIETTSESAYKDVANRFYATHDVDDSLFLAKSYYSKGNYKKAEYWALETNKVNNNIEESWLIFVKSKIKQNNKNEAIRILSNYIKRSNSQKAKKLLSEIKKD